jgi:RNA polymerase sigma factor for flagellar operon FliA
VDNDLHDAEFIRQYDAFVRGIVRQVRAQLGIESDPEDLVSSAFEGLLEARTRFDPSRGVQFKSFAYYRVRGALIDQVRKMAYLPRRAYARLKAVEALDLEGDQAEQARAAAGGAMDLEGALRGIDGILGQVAAAYCTAAAAAPDDAEHDPEQRLLGEERRARVQRVLEKLPERERALVHGHYFGGRRFDEIAAELGISKSRASRIHTQALRMLRDELSD